MLSFQSDEGEASQSENKRALRECVRELRRAATIAEGALAKLDDCLKETVWSNIPGLLRTLVATTGVKHIQNCTYSKFIAKEIYKHIEIENQSKGFISAPAKREQAGGDEEPVDETVLVWGAGDDQARRHREGVVHLQLPEARLFHHTCQIKADNGVAHQ